MSYWGQGSTKNFIYWGEGSVDSSINWGLIHFDSYGHPDTNLSGMFYELKLLIDRVAADSGELIAIICTNNSIKNIL